MSHAWLATGDFVPRPLGDHRRETEIAEPDRESVRCANRARRHRNSSPVSSASWGLLVDGPLQSGLPPAEPFPVPVHSATSGHVKSAISILAPTGGLQHPFCLFFFLFPLLFFCWNIDDVQWPGGPVPVAPVTECRSWPSPARGIGLPWAAKAHRQCATILRGGSGVRWRATPIRPHQGRRRPTRRGRRHRDERGDIRGSRDRNPTGADVAACLSGAGCTFPVRFTEGRPPGAEEARRVRGRGDAERYVKRLLDSKQSAH